MKPIAVAGHLCLDIFPSLAAHDEGLLARLEPGRLFEIGPVTFGTGGVVSNTGLSLVRFGVPTLLLGKVGDDLFGREISDRFSQAANARYLRVTPRESTSYTIVLAPQGVDRIFFHHPGTNDTFSAADVDFDRLDGARVFHFGYPPLMRRMYEHNGDELLSLFRTAAARGLVTSLDLALPDPASAAGKAPWKEILARVLPHVRIFLPSVEELFSMLDPQAFARIREAARGRDLVDAVPAREVARLADAAIAMGAHIVVVKCGKRGLCLRTAPPLRLGPALSGLGLDPDAWGDRELWQPCFTVPRIVSATGAGDCAIAGFLAALVRGLGPEAALRYAAAAGAFNLSAADAVSGIPSWEEATRAIAGSWALAPLDLADPAWARRPDGRFWSGPRDSGAAG